VLVLIVLSACPELRIGDLQILEMVQAARIILVAFLLASIGLKVPSADVWQEYGRFYLCFLAGSFVLAIVALRLPSIRLLRKRHF
jgi:hypothetical protein